MELSSDLFNLLFSFMSVWGTVTLVLRTEKTLDLAAKMFFVVSMIMFISSVLKLDSGVGIISDHYSDSIFYISRLMAIFFFYLGIHFLVNMTKNK